MLIGIQPIVPLLVPPTLSSNPDRLQFTSTLFSLPSCFLSYIRQYRFPFSRNKALLHRIPSVSVYPCNTQRGGSVMARPSSLRLPLIRESSADKLSSDFRGKYNLQNHVVNSCFCMTLRVPPLSRGGRNQRDHPLNIIRRGGSSRATFRNCLLRFFRFWFRGILIWKGT